MKGIKAAVNSIAMNPEMNLARGRIRDCLTRDALSASGDLCLTKPDYQSREGTVRRLGVITRNDRDA
jgi:hypothetical protein